MSSAGDTPRRTEGALNDAQRRLVVDHGLVAARVSRRFGPSQRGLQSKDDVEQLARLGLVEAARSYRPELEVPFAGYAWRVVCGAVLHGARGESRHRARVRILIEAALEAPVTDTTVLSRSDEQAREELARAARRAMTAIAVGVVPTGHAGLDGRPAREARAAEEVGAMLAVLDEPERGIIERRLVRGEKLRHIARDLGMGYSTARRHFSDGLDRMRRAMVGEET